jgi:hypothetical protein
MLNQSALDFVLERVNFKPEGYETYRRLYKDKKLAVESEQ